METKERNISICGDCGVMEGQLHEPGCDMERCPICGYQYIGCYCDKTAAPQVPFINYPIICARCGKLWPAFFKVPDAEWKKYIQISERDKVICSDCYEHIKWLIASEG